MKADTAPGPGVDAAGDRAIDPTANVIAIVDAASRRQDDLRIETNRRLDTEISHIKELLAHRLEHLKELRLAESERVNAIRQTDVAGGASAAAQTLAAVQTLAATTENNAAAIRMALNTTATTIAAQTANTVASINERISNLEKASYEFKGKEAVSDPLLEQALRELRAVRDNQTLAAGKTQGVSLVWVVLLGAVSLVSGLLGIGGVLYAAFKG